jgi:pSer/pThr/pTyr-binding forkhead associated (FHA) protein
MITKTRLAVYKNNKLDLGFPLVETAVTIGRDNGNSVQLPDTKVSKFHATVRPEEGQWVIEDLGSTNGTRVNGNVVKIATLANGDRIGIGPFVLRFETSVDGEWVPSFMMEQSSMIAEQTIIHKDGKP